MKVTRYHKFLRVSALVTATVLLFDGGFISPFTKQLSNTTISYVASVGSGMYASVPPNEYNSLTAQISEQQRLLDAREAALREREISARDYGDAVDYSTYILSAILFVLTVLIVLNYIMDWVRVRSMRYEKSMG